MEDYSVTDESKQGILHTNSYVSLGDQENNYTEISNMNLLMKTTISQKNRGSQEPVSFTWL